MRLCRGAPLALALVLWAGREALPQDPGPQQAEVRDARVEGNLATKEDTILDYLGIKRGQPYNPSAVRDGIKFLWLRVRVRVDEVRVEIVEPGAARVFVKVTEEPTAGTIEVRGNVSFEQKELLEAANVISAESLDPVKADRVRRELLRFYKDRGYVFCDVRLTMDAEARKAIYEVMEGPLARIRTLDFVGNRAFPARTFLGFGKHLTGVMDSRERHFIFRGSEFSERKLRQDLVQIRKFYRDEGYRDAVVDYLPPKFTEDGSLVDLTVLIDEGRLYRVASVDILGVKAFPKEEVLAKIKMKPGDPYTLDRILTDFRSVQRFYGEHGYVRHPSLMQDSWQMRLPPESVFREDENDALVDVVYEVFENTPKFVRDVKIQGNRVTQDPVIRRALSFNPGEEADQPKIEQSIQRLDALQYFDTIESTISYRYVDTADPAWKDITIELAEGRTGSFNVAGGLSSNNGLFAVFSFTKRNFDLFNTPSSLSNALPEIIDGQAFTGAGQELNLQLAPGIQLSQYDIRFTEPDLFGDHKKPVFFSFDIYYRTRRYPANTETRIGQLVSVGKALDEHWSLDATLRNETVKISDIDPAAPAIIFDEDGRNALRTLRFGLGYFDTDLPIEPTRGTNFRTDVEFAGGPLGGQIDYTKLDVVGRKWIPLGRDDENHPYTFFLQGRAGAAFPTQGSTEIPYSERYYLGGEGSIRGFFFRGVGPVSQGVPIGGQVYYVANAEVRFPIFATRLPGRDDDVEVFRGVLFLDAGSLGLDPSDPTLWQLRMSAGVGLRVRIPFLPQLPIALHFGYPLMHEKTDDLRAFSFTIGQF